MLWCSSTRSWIQGGMVHQRRDISQVSSVNSYFCADNPRYWPSISYRNYLDSFKEFFPTGGLSGEVFISDIPNFNAEMRNIQKLGHALSEMDKTLQPTSGTNSFHNAFIDFVNSNLEAGIVLQLFYCLCCNVQHSVVCIYDVTQVNIIQWTKQLGMKHLMSICWNSCLPVAQPTDQVYNFMLRRAVQCLLLI